MTRTRSIPILLGLLTSTFVLGGCVGSMVSDGLARVTPYRVEIVQGNVITREQIDAVKPGMNREQVRGLMGSPLLTDTFHAQRWDYVFTLRRQGMQPQRRSVVAWFEGDVLKKIDAPGDLPSEIEFVAGMTRANPTGAVPKLELTEAERQALPPATRPDVAAPVRTAPARTFPPLEPAS